jgi:protein-S-isoprenylcysteine O-methyltransferase Ste14
LGLRLNGLDAALQEGGRHAKKRHIWELAVESGGYRHSLRASIRGGELRYFFADRLKVIRQTKLYDLFAAAPLIVWLLVSVLQMLPELAEQIGLAKAFFQISSSALPVSLVLRILSKICTLAFLAVLVFMFAVRRVPRHYAHGFYPRFAAMVGTFISVGIVWLPWQQLSTTVYLVSLLLIIGGTAFAVCAALVLGRSISIMPEARRLITRGPYTLIRHPLYLGEMVATAGLALQYLMPWALLLLGLHCFFQFERMRYEERVLAQAFPEYGDYMAGTARLVPGVY